MKYLSLEQCKKLKELGAPQDTTLKYGRKYTFPFKESNATDAWVVFYGSLADEDFIACPTLEELIEWLSNSFTSLIKDDVENSWIAYGKPNAQALASTALETCYELALKVRGK